MTHEPIDPRKWCKSPGEHRWSTSCLDAHPYRCCAHHGVPDPKRFGEAQAAFASGSPEKIAAFLNADEHLTCCDFCRGRASEYDGLIHRLGEWVEYCDTLLDRADRQRLVSLWLGAILVFVIVALVAANIR